MCILTNHFNSSSDECNLEKTNIRRSLLCISYLISLLDKYTGNNATCKKYKDFKIKYYSNIKFEDHLKIYISRVSIYSINIKILIRDNNRYTEIVS